MILFLQLIFWFCVLAMAHSYVFYPILLKIMARNKKSNQLVYNLQHTEQLPLVSILMAAYNEEKVLGEKLESIFQTDYPLDKIEIWVGSDNSTDQTHEILDRFSKKYPQLQYKVFQRQGKANILNQLQPLAKGEIYIFTDANVFFSKQLIFELVKHFKNPKIGQVGANFINKGMQKEGIGVQEKGYIQRETLIKYNEGIIWGTMMGVFGGCFALRATNFVKNPERFIAEDFYISMQVLASGKQAILEPHAEVFEDVPNKFATEFKRKIRISIGNFQNLGVFYKLLIPPYKGLGFSFLSHKVLRWLGPFFILFALVSSALLGWVGYNFFYKTLFILQVAGLLGVPLLDFVLKKANINIFLLRYIAYFNAMNLALLTGFFKYIKGVKTNVWQPTERNIK